MHHNYAINQEKLCNFIDKVPKIWYNNGAKLHFTHSQNADGVRTSKTANGIKHEYTLNGSQVLADRWTEDGEEYLMIFFYDETGAPVGFKFRTSSYANDEFDYYFYEKRIILTYLHGQL